MKIKLKRPYGIYVTGDVVDFEPGVAEQLIQRGRAEPMTESGAKRTKSQPAPIDEPDADVQGEKAITQPPAHKAILEPRKQK